jgi:hypothetical protein
MALALQAQKVKNVTTTANRQVAAAAAAAAITAAKAAAAAAGVAYVDPNAPQLTPAEMAVAKAQKAFDDMMAKILAATVNSDSDSGSDGGFV